MNRWLKPVSELPGSNLADRGRGAARDPRILRLPWGSTPKPSETVGHEATLNACGAGVAMLSVRPEEHGHIPCDLIDWPVALIKDFKHAMVVVRFPNDTDDDL